MPVSPYLNGIRISNFRAIVEPLEVPLRRKISFLIGQNNSGKTSILRFLGLLLNNGESSPDDQSTFTNKDPEVEFLIDSSAIRDFAKSYRNLGNAIAYESSEQFTMVRSLKPGNPISCTDDLFDIIDETYLADEGRRFVNDFGNAYSKEQNIALLLGTLLPTLGLPKTIFVPSQRMILQSGQSIPQFGQIEFPGTKIGLNSIVDSLASLDRPYGLPAQRDEARTKLSNICKFIAYCLEVQQVELNVADGRHTIYAKIDGNEQPISNLGSGIEQLIVIGMGSFMFPGHLVLIDEPEIHFHPRTQKRMMQFLGENADAKFVIATHSAAIVDSVEADIVQVYQQANKCTGNVVRGNKDRYEAIRNLGHSPSEFVLANFVIWVEGPSDRIYINHFIEKLDSSLKEGVDYAIIFYGGSILAKHEFEDSERDFVKALSISRNFAVYMDSDKHSETDVLKSRVERVSKEVESNSGLTWVSTCREIENYIPAAVIGALEGFDCNDMSQYGRVVKADKFDKVKFAECATAIWGDEWPFDLKDRCDELVERIRQAR